MSIFSGAFGAVAGGLTSLIGSSLTNRGNKHIANRQMSFQDQMSSTAYQRAVKDMRAANLNPMLAYQQGGASTPSGAGIAMNNVLGDAVEGASNSAKAVAEVKNMSEMNKNIQSQTKLNQEQIALNKALQVKALEDAKASQANARNSRAVARLNELQEAGAKNKAEVNSTAYGKAMDYVDKAGGAVSGVVGGFLGGALSNATKLFKSGKLFKAKKRFQNKYPN
jgi:TolA-binding protein